MFRTKFKGLSVLMIMISVLMVFHANVSAYTATAYSNVYESSGDIEFTGNYSDDASPSAIEYISYYSESKYYDAILANISMDDDTHTYSSFSSYYTKTDPSEGMYVKYTIGRTRYEPPIQYENTADDVDTYSYENSKSLYTLEEADFFDKLYQDIAKAFNIDIRNYNKLSSFVNKKVDLTGIEKQLSLKYGDVYAIYLNSNNSAGIVLKQDLEGVYTLYKFTVNDDNKIGFKITGVDKLQGEYKFINDYFIKNPKQEAEENLY
jgi:hypothetical protein